MSIQKVKEDIKRLEEDRDSTFKKVPNNYGAQYHAVARDLLHINTQLNLLASKLGFNNYTHFKASNENI